MNLSDDQFENQFSTGVFDAADFTHAAHIRLAWVHISKYGVKVAERNIQKQLKTFVASLGATDKYHTTMTIAAIKSVHHFINKSKSGNFKDFIQEFPRLKSDFKSLMSQHYGYDIYKSQEARLSFVGPDLLPFD